MSKCEDCGTENIEDCFRCGAPNCCPKCCDISTKELIEQVTTEKTALERLKQLWIGDCPASVSRLHRLLDAIDDELAAEQAKTHKEILMEAFEKCGMYTTEHTYSNGQTHVAVSMGLWFDSDGSLRK